MGLSMNIMRYTILHKHNTLYKLLPESVGLAVSGSIIWSLFLIWELLSLVRQSGLCVGGGGYAMLANNCVTPHVHSPYPLPADMTIQSHSVSGLCMSGIPSPTVK